MPAATPTELKALRILAEFKDAHDRVITPKAFAKAMWPNSPGWKSLTKCGGKGVTPGGAMPQAGGMVLGRLTRRGLIHPLSRTLTHDGRKLIGHEAGFTLPEVVVGTLVVSILFVVIINLSGSFFGGDQMMQIGSVNNRSRVESVGQDIRSATVDARRTFGFQGQLALSDGTPFMGGRLILSKPLDTISDANDFLASSGLQVVGTGASVISLNDPIRPVVISTNVRVRGDGWREFTLDMISPSSSSHATFSARPDEIASRITAASGRVAVGPDGSVSLTLPNPLALSAARMPQVEDGNTLLFPNLPSRTYP